MPKYHAVYRVQVNPEWNIPPYFYDREPGTGKEISISFAAELGNLSDSQLDSVIGQVKYNSVQISQSTDQPPLQLDFGIVHLIKEGVFNGLSAADQIRINRMVNTYSRATDDKGFNIDLFKPLALCVKYARLFKKIKPASETAQDGKRKRIQKKDTIKARLFAYAKATNLIERVEKNEVTPTSEYLAEAVAIFDGLKKPSSSAIRKTSIWLRILRIQERIKIISEGYMRNKDEDDDDDGDNDAFQYRTAKSRYDEEEDMLDEAIDAPY